MSGDPVAIGVKWRTCFGRINRVEFSRETAGAVWILERPFRIDEDRKTRLVERRKLKQSELEQFHDSWDQAMAYLNERSREEIADALCRLAEARERCEKLKAMQNPDLQKASS